MSVRRRYVAPCAGVAFLSFNAAGAGGSLLAKFNDSPVPAPETIVTVRALGELTASS